nr:alpha-amylase family glycosyl hydrolase [uncultured Acetatifactor sp.]
MADYMERNGALAYSREFDERYGYDGKDLGAVCRDGRTVFKVWSPMAERVELRLYHSGSSKAWLKKELQPQDRGVWVLEFAESLHGMYYDYVVRAEGKDRRTADPYAVGCCCNGARSMVVDLALTDPPGFSSDAAPEECGERIIYELHIKDFSHDPDSGVPEAFRGKYKAFTVEGIGAGGSGGSPHSADAAGAAGSLCPEGGLRPANGPSLTGMAYLKSLGVTHVHLLPFFDYGSVDEAVDVGQFNWGYDPVNYNVPEGSYATDASDGTVRIRECKEMIQALHRAGLRVVMDVVYNHTHRGDSWLERTAPGYYYRRGEDGELSNGSGCGNDIAAGRAMADNYIADSVLYWAREYHVDGFRFDLMGLMTVELMNRIRRELDEAFGPGEKLLYGEPWSAGPSPMEEGTTAAVKKNVAMLQEGIAIFCDDTRDAIKGSVFDGTAPGFVNGGTGFEEAVLQGVTGWREGGAGYVPKSCGQIVNYVSAHDNFTLWDKLVLSMHGEDADFSAGYEDVLAANRLAALIYFTCQGNLFLQAGEEFGRTKLGDENSYCAPPELNMLDWSRAAEYSELVEYYRGLIRLRKKLPGLCDKSPSAAERIGCQEIHREGVVSFRVDNRSGADRNPGSGASPWEELFIVYNGSEEDFAVGLPEDSMWAEESPGLEDGPGPGRWEILADGLEADCRRQVELPEGPIRVAARSGMLLGKTGAGEDAAS